MEITSAHMLTHHPNTGNLSSERVTKRDIFHVFHRYGDLAQISIKQAYGFVQYLQTDACSRAIEIEQGKTIRGKKIRMLHLVPLILSPRKFCT